MQRRAAAIYVLFFLVVAAGAYTALAVAEEPSIQLGGQDAQNYTTNGTLTVGDRTYTVGNISGGAEGASTELNYTNESARLTLTIANNSTVARYANGSYRPLGEGESPASGGGGSSTGNATANGSATGGNATTGGGANATGNASTPGNGSSGANGSSNASGSASGSAGPGTRNESVSVYRAVVANGSDNTTRLSMTEEFNVSALLSKDSAVENATLEANGTRYVRYTDNNTTVPVDSYLPEAQMRNFTQGDSLQYGSNNTTIESLNQQGATLAWTGTQATITEVESGNVTLGETQYVAHFPDNSTLTLSQDVEAYQEEQAAVESYHERILSFWGIIILCLATVGLLVGLAYLPVRG